ncbi:endoribonuclease MazF [candidate division CSSED10-310 bacterium]|uniref:Endoribonuclease MazF n=1 Tax=candidate division CSSED10-310 bacterium TaxID=2855610 RepID=A0ABV6Z5V1_UNCC1
MVDSERYIPDRGDVVWITLNPQAGHEQAGRRPLVIMSPAAYNEKVGLALLCPITHRIKGYPFEVIIPKSLDVRGVILSDQIKCLDWQVRNAEFLCSLPSNTVDEILQKIIALLTR